MASKNPQTFEEFLRVWGKALRSKAYYRSLTMKSGYWGREDLYQEMLMGAWVGWNKWPPDSTIPRDLYALTSASRHATNRILRDIRKKRGNPGHLSYIEDIDGAQLYREQESAAWLGKYVKRLPKEDQEFLRKFFVVGEEVAKMSRKYCKSSVSNKLRRAIQTLRKDLTAPTLKIRRTEGRDFNRHFAASHRNIPVPSVVDPVRDRIRKQRNKNAKRIAL
jgi:DNA-directed RNA polymerase specialized sigma24 family protein